MPGRWERYLISRLKRAEVSFSEKLRQVANTLPQADSIGCIQMINTLLESALNSRPSYEDLYALCEVSERYEVVHEYIRGFFLAETHDPRRTEMAERLENVISLRMAEHTAHRPDHALHQTLSEYLLRARN